MAIKRQEKEALIQQYVSAFKQSKAVFLSSYSGLTVQQMERVRRALAQEETELEVVRNTLLRRAAREVGLEEQLTRVLQGPTLAIFCKGDPTSPAKTLVALHRELEPLNVYGGLLGERVLSQADFELLASLPGRDVMLARVVGTLQAPIAGFVGVLSGVLRSLLYVLQARAQQLQEAAG